MFDTGYLNKLKDDRSWLESILPHVNNEAAKKEVERKIKDLHGKVEMQNKILSGSINAFFEMVSEDETLALRLAKVVDEAFRKEAFRKEAKSADLGE